MQVLLHICSVMGKVKLHCNISLRLYKVWNSHPLLVELNLFKSAHFKTWMTMHNFQLILEKSISLVATNLYSLESQRKIRLLSDFIDNFGVEIF